MGRRQAGFVLVLLLGACGPTTGGDTAPDAATPRVDAAAQPDAAPLDGASPDAAPAAIDAAAIDAATVDAAAVVDAAMPDARVIDAQPADATVCASGYGADDAGTCLDINECTSGSATCDPHALCLNTPGSYTCTCAPGYAGNGRSCTGISCAGLPTPANATLVLSNGGVYPSTASYACNLGFMLVGNATRACNTDGTWTGSTPACDVQACQTLTNPVNGSVSTTNANFYPSTATYACNPGYALAGALTRTCAGDGSWSGSAPTCSPITCQALGAPVNGTVAVSNGGSFPSTATYSCGVGYAVTGSATRACNPDGSSAGSAPTCDPLQCRP